MVADFVQQLITKILIHPVLCSYTNVAEIAE